MQASHAAGCAALLISSLLLTSCGLQDIAVPFPDRTQTSAIAPSFGLPGMPLPGFGERDPLPPAEQRCRKRLKRLGVSFRDLPPIRETATCGIDHPVEVAALARGVKLTPKATLTCDMAEEMARWVQGDLAPAARTRYLTGIAEIRQTSSYSCRRIRGTTRWSSHSTGNAIDIGAIKLKNGHVIDVRRQGLFAFRARSLLNSARGKACGHFNTVLGPGYDRDHRDHFHFDLRERRSNRRFCS
ncbi:extensin family protein [Oricola sp.]|uniref:extensin-like domain-containing protein n=1 Tax=Oricola sp. TaxID=1979950 RepID=UPI003BA96206